MISRSCYFDDRAMRDLGDKLAHKKPLIPTKLSVPAASLLMAESEIGKAVYNKLGKLVRNEGIDVLPSYKDVSNFHRHISHLR